MEGRKRETRKMEGRGRIAENVEEVFSETNF